MWASSRAHVLCARVHIVQGWIICMSISVAYSACSAALPVRVLCVALQALSAPCPVSAVRSLRDEHAVRQGAAWAGENGGGGCWEGGNVCGGRRIEGGKEIGRWVP